MTQAGFACRVSFQLQLQIDDAMQPYGFDCADPTRESRFITADSAPLISICVRKKGKIKCFMRTLAAGKEVAAGSSYASEAKTQTDAGFIAEKFTKERTKHCLLFPTIDRKKICCETPRGKVYVVCGFRKPEKKKSEDEEKILTAGIIKCQIVIIR